MTDLQKQINEKWKLVEEKRLKYEKAESERNSLRDDYYECRRSINDEIEELKRKDALERYGFYIGQYFVTEDNHSWTMLGRITGIYQGGDSFTYEGFRLEIKEKKENWDLSISHFNTNTIDISELTYKKEARLISRDEALQILYRYQNQFSSLGKEF